MVVDAGICCAGLMGETFLGCTVALSIPKNKYGSIEYVLGHYQQDFGNEVGLWIENVPDYYAYKIDPGPIFMKRLSENLVGSQLTFFEL